eukprot:4613114-Prymnesium_polylepis.1
MDDAAPLRRTEKEMGGNGARASSGCAVSPAERRRSRCESSMVTRPGFDATNQYCGLEHHLRRVDNAAAGRDGYSGAQGSRREAVSGSDNHGGGCARWPRWRPATAELTPLALDRDRLQLAARDDSEARVEAADQIGQLDPELVRRRW